jgi:hypothetical protein
VCGSCVYAVGSVCCGVCIVCGMWCVCSMLGCVCCTAHLLRRWSAWLPGMEATGEGEFPWDGRGSCTSVGGAIFPDQVPLTSTACAQKPFQDAVLGMKPLGPWTAVRKFP